ncbi:MAG: flippase-like domain-containing protein [Anaerolineaceae bacterium]|nr:flippase-like domain-containing protein [Anaerolineaceae bacterium]
MAVIFLILAIRGVSWDEMIQTVCQSDPGLLVFVFLLITINLFFRGLRWGILLSGENPIQALTMFWATADGYLGNTLLPARAGELIRSAIVGIKTGIGTSYVFATAMTERIVDAVVLVLIGLILLPGITGLPDWVPTTLHVMAVVGVIGLLVIITLPYIERMLRKILSILPFPESWKTKLGELLGRFVLGTRAFINPVRAAGFLGLTPIIWMLDGYITVQVAKALSLSLTLSQALILMVALGLASALPSTPGYVGIYQYVATTILPVFGMSKSEALTFILLYQGMAVMAFLLWGLISLPVLNIRPAALRQLGEKQSTNEIDVS